MATSDWLVTELEKIKGVEAWEEGGLVCATKGSKTYRIYCPEDRYMVTVDDVQTAVERRADIVGFPNRMQSSKEAVEYGNGHGVRVIGFRAVFGIFNTR